MGHFVVTPNGRRSTYTVELTHGVDRIRCLITLSGQVFKDCQSDQEREAAALGRALILARELLGVIEDKLVPRDGAGV